MQGGWHPASWLVFFMLTLASLLVGSMVITRAKAIINEYI
jgi:hypothetical protein